MEHGGRRCPSPLADASSILARSTINALFRGTILRVGSVKAMFRQLRESQEASNWLGRRSLPREPGRAKEHINRGGPQDDPGCSPDRGGNVQSLEQHHAEKVAENNRSSGPVIEVEIATDSPEEENANQPPG